MIILEPVEYFEENLKGGVEDNVNFLCRKTKIFHKIYVAKAHVSGYGKERVCFEGHLHARKLSDLINKFSAKSFQDKYEKLKEYCNKRNMTIRSKTDASDEFLELDDLLSGTLEDRANFKASDVIAKKTESEI